MRLNSFEYTDGEKIGKSPAIDKNQFCSVEDLNNIASATSYNITYNTAQLFNCK